MISGILFNVKQNKISGISYSKLNKWIVYSSRVERKLSN